MLLLLFLISNVENTAVVIVGGILIVAAIGALLGWQVAANRRR